MFSLLCVIIVDDTYNTIVHLESFDLHKIHSKTLNVSYHTGKASVTHLHYWFGCILTKENP